MSSAPNNKTIALAIMIIAPAFFSTNLIFGRFVADQTDPFLLAFIRWSCVALILLPFGLSKDRAAFISVIKRHWLFFVVLAFLGMGISGSGVYLGLQSTTATNATLIYSTAPILIILIERITSNRRSSAREMFGIAIAFLGVAIIVLNGDLTTLFSMQFNIGDVLILAAALSWAGYSILYRSARLSHLSSVSLFSVIAIFGALINLPPAMIAFFSGEQLPQSSSAWLAILGIILISSLLAFSAYQYGVRALGASVAGLFMYLMTPYGVLMAVIFLGERLASFHYWGIVCVMVGVGLAIFPKSLFKNRSAKRL